MKLRKPVPDDAPALSRIIYDAFAGIAQAHRFPIDFPSPDAASGLIGFFISNPAVVGFIAEDDSGRMLGSNFLDKRDAIAAVGPITVDPAQQSKGVGRRLMQAVIDAGRDATGIRLVQDAFNTASMSLYTSLGFNAKEPLALMRGRPKAPAAEIGTEARAMREADLPACAELCRKIHGIDRTNELRDAIKMFRPWVLVRGGRVVAYASAPTFWFLNHGVAETRADMEQLLAAAGAASEEPLMMLVPSRQAELMRWCLAQGLRMVKPMTLMAMGEYHEPHAGAAWFPSVAY
jgi:GNAT superfamily N-acetyltransferase